MDWYYRQRETERDRIKQLQEQRNKLEEHFRIEEDEIKSELTELEQRKQEEKVKIKRVHENRIKIEQQLHQQERELSSFPSGFGRKKVS